MSATRTKEKPTPAFRWSDIDRVRQTASLAVDDPCPGKSFTAAEYAEKYGLNASTAMFQLNRLVAQGRLKHGRKWATNRRGHRQLVRCFWLP